MKHRFLIFILLSIFTLHILNTFAQETNLNATSYGNTGKVCNPINIAEIWEFGITTGLNFNLPYFKPMTNAIDLDQLYLGYDVGLLVGYTYHKFSFRTGASYVTKGGSSANLNANLRISYVEVPLSVYYSFAKHKLIGCPQAIAFELSPYIGFLTDAKQLSNNENSHVNSLYNINMGIRFGLNIHLGTFEPSIGYDLGLLNISQIGTLYTRGFYFKLALVLGR